MSTHPPSFRCPNCRTEIALSPVANPRSPRRWWWRPGLLFAVLLVIGVVVLTYRYRGQATSLLLLANNLTGSTGLSIVAFAVVALLALGVVGWFMLPFLLMWAYLDLRRRLGRSPVGPQGDRIDTSSITSPPH